MQMDLTGLLPSPCVGTCLLDEATGYCSGCGRTGEEIAGWGERSASAQFAIWRDVPGRLERLQVPFRMLPWSGPRLWRLLLGLSNAEGARWELVGRGVALSYRGRGSVVARGARGLGDASGDDLLEVRDGSGLRVFLNEHDYGLGCVLTQHKARFRELPPQRVTDLGFDRRALRHLSRDDRLFDLGLGRTGVRLMVRSPDGSAIQILRALCGKTPVPEELRQLNAADVTWIGEGPLGRVETASPPAPVSSTFTIPDGYVPLLRLWVPGDARRLDYLIVDAR